MLSAIAARKAAQAAREQQAKPRGDIKNNDSEPLRTPSPSSPSDSDLELSQSPPPPRKRKAQDSESPHKKRQKRKTRLTNAELGRTRYFEAQQPIEGFDDDEQSEIPEALTPAYRAYSPSRPVQNIEFTRHLDLELSTDVPDPSRELSPSRQVPDSSEDEDQPQESSENFRDSQNAQILSRTLPRPVFTPSLDSNTFRLTNSELEGLLLPVDISTLILLAPGHVLSFVGTAIITLLQGTVSILGTPLAPSLQPHRIFSPRSSPLVSLEAQPFPGEASASILQPFHFNGGILPQRIQSVVRASDSVVVLRRLHTGVEGLGRVCRTFEGVFTVDKEDEAEDAIGIAGFHPVDLQSYPHPQLQPFFLPESWGEALNSVVRNLDEPALPSQSTSLVALVKGPKKCGKSTLARTLLNRLITRYQNVAFLECDLGQSEFTPGGMVSLHVVSKPVFGPPFTHPTRPHRAHYVGHTTPRSSPAYYMSCIQALMQTYRLDVQYAYNETFIGTEDNDRSHDSRIEGFVPLVVNTQGWVKGLGGDLLRKIEEIVQATDIFELDARAGVLPRQRQPYTHAHSSIARVHVLQPIVAPSLATYYTAADHRTHTILSYFHHCFGETGKWAAELPLCAQPPWEVDCSEAIDRIVLVGAGYEDVIPQELDRAINCGIVALICDEDPVMESPETDLKSFPYEQGGSVPSPTTSHCEGLAIIRGVDTSTRMLHVLTPLPPAVLAQCRVLVKGELELPVWGMLDFREGAVDGVAGVAWDKVPYLQMGGAVGAGAGRKRVRRNLMRRAQI